MAINHYHWIEKLKKKSKNQKIKINSIELTKWQLITITESKNQKKIIKNKQIKIYSIKLTKWQLITITEWKNK